MPSRDPTGWMWAEACQMLEQAEQLHRQFFRLGTSSGARSVWEPPVDVYEDEHTITVVVALPGVASGHAEVTLDSHGLLVRAERRLPMEDHECAIRRLEIPYGYFERRITLPTDRLEPVRRDWADGLLVLELRKVR